MNIHFQVHSTLKFTESFSVYYIIFALILHHTRMVHTGQILVPSL